MRFVAIGLAATLAVGCVVKEPKVSASEFYPVAVNDGRFVPIKVVPPQYPEAASRTRLSGQCVVELTVNKDGTTKDHRVTWSSSSIFDTSCLAAAKALTYPPHLLDGRPVEITGVKYSYVFKYGH